MYVELKNINKTFGNYKASDNVNFTIEQGKLIGLLGPSGSGKTTILRMIAGLETPDSGEIIIDGKVVNDIPASKRGIGFVFQNYALFRYMTVFDNIAFGLKIQKKDKKYIKERVSELVELIGLKGLEKRYPSQLSGGQKQRVAIAGIIAMRPECIILDEPTAMLDPQGRKEVLKTIRRLNREAGITIVLITHYMDEAAQSDRVVVLDKGQVVFDDVPSEVFSNVEELKRIGLDVPQTTELVYLLRKEGIDLDSHIISEDECADAIEALFRTSNNNDDDKAVQAAS